MSDQELYEQAIEAWGEGAQLGMAQEECGELITIISRRFRGRGDDADLAEEIADVEIMCEQLRLIVGDEQVAEHKAEKLNRLRERLNDSE